MENERKQADELLMLRKAVDASGEVIFMTDRDGMITFVNAEFTRVYGYSTAEVVGKSTPRILKSGIMKPEEYETFWKTLLSNRVVRGELINKTKDGRLLIVEGSANPILDDHQEIIGFLAIQRDITARKQMEDELRKAVAQVKTLQEFLPICSSCKKIRDEQGSWSQVESYISKHSNTRFSHDICPECAKKLYPDYVD